MVMVHVPNEIQMTRSLFCWAQCRMFSILGSISELIYKASLRRMFRAIDCNSGFSPIQCRNKSEERFHLSLWIKKFNLLSLLNNKTFAMKVRPKRHTFHIVSRLLLSIWMLFMAHGACIEVEIVMASWGSFMGHNVYASRMPNRLGSSKRSFKNIFFSFSFQKWLGLNVLKVESKFTLKNQ